MLEEYKRKRDFSITPEPPAHQARDGNLRVPVFMRLRTDKDPRECTLEGIEGMYVLTS